MAKYTESKYQLRFDVNSLENIILRTIDRFDIKAIIHQDEESQMRALLLTSSLALLGGFLGHKLQSGHVGTLMGGAVGAACGLGMAAVSMRDVWQDQKEDLGELLKLVYKYLLKLNIKDYYAADTFLMNHVSAEKALAELIIRYLSKKFRNYFIIV